MIGKIFQYFGACLDNIVLKISVGSVSGLDQNCQPEFGFCIQKSDITDFPQFGQVLQIAVNLVTPTPTPVPTYTEVPSEG